VKAFVGSRVYIQDVIDEEPLECVILRYFKWAGHHWVRCRIVDSKAIVVIQVRSIDRIWPTKKAKVLSHKLKAVK
jgi:hypothetical protein